MTLSPPLPLPADKRPHLTKSKALDLLRRLLGPTARFQTTHAAGLTGLTVIAKRNGADFVYARTFQGTPDSRPAALAYGALQAAGFAIEACYDAHGNVAQLVVSKAAPKG